MTQANCATVDSALDEQLYLSLCAELAETSDHHRDVESEALHQAELLRFFSRGPSEIDVEELLQHYDGAGLLLFSDDAFLAADREYVAAYLASSRPGPNPTLAIPYFDDAVLQRALRARDHAPFELAQRAFQESLSAELGQPLPPGVMDLLQIALDRGIALIACATSKTGDEHLEALAKQLHLAARRGPTIALVQDRDLRPSWVEHNFVRQNDYETVAVWQSPPALHWLLRESNTTQDLPHAVHLQGTWAFATLATHPVFRAAAPLAFREDDVLLPPRPAHSSRRMDAPMIEMLLGAGDLVRTMVHPSLRSPETVLVTTFLEPALETRLIEAGLDLAQVEHVMQAAARGECIALPEHNLVHLGQPRLAPALEALVRVLVEPSPTATPTNKTQAREMRYARTTRAEALAFFASGLIAGKRLWPEEEEPSDPLASRVMNGLDRLEHSLESLSKATLVPRGAERDDDTCALRLGRFLGARLLVAVDARVISFERACLLFDARPQNSSARTLLLDLARVALS